MRYNKIISAIFIERPNRFVAYCEVDGTVHKVHVKNTGRCKELLIKGVTVYLEESDNPKRATKYSLIAVQKKDRLINMDSQAPNVVVEEALRQGHIKLPSIESKITLIKREKTFGNSRFDLYLETEQDKIFIEVKGVTLEQGDYVMFPDAQTARGAKHVEELILAQKEGYKCFVIFVIQMENIKYFIPHRERDPKFTEVLTKASSEGVGILAYESKVTLDTLEISKQVPVYLER